MKVNDVWLDRLRHEYEIASSYVEGQEIPHQGGRLINYTVGYDSLFGSVQFVDFIESDVIASQFVIELQKRKERLVAKWLQNVADFQFELDALDNDIVSFCEKHKVSKFDRTTRKPKVINHEPEWNELQMNDWVESQKQIYIYICTNNMQAKLLGLDRTINTLTQESGQQEYQVRRTEFKELQATLEGIRDRLNLTYRSICINWLYSGYYALEQLRKVKRVILGEIYYGQSEPVYSIDRIVFPPWHDLVKYCAPRIFRGKKYISQANKGSVDANSVPIVEQQLIQIFLKRVYASIHSLAISQISHQLVVSRYKIRCVHYDRDNILKLLGDYAKSVQEKEKTRLEYEKLLTMHFARYLFDNGYPVHVALRSGGFEPDLLGKNFSPLVVEAKVVGQDGFDTENNPTSKGKKWIVEGARQLHSYLRDLSAEHDVSEGYLVTFRMSQKCSPYFPDKEKWKLGRFTIYPIFIDLAGTEHKQGAVEIKESEVLAKIESEDE